jgi:uncharacterized protein YqeY
MKAELQAQLIVAMKAKDRLRSDVIRSIISEIKYAEIEKSKDPLPAEDCLAIVQREIKKRKEELEFNEKSGRSELIDKCKQELQLLSAFLPAQLSEADISSRLEEFKVSQPDAAMGLAMKHLKDNFAGQYDAKLASELAKKIFS